MKLHVKQALIAFWRVLNGRDVQVVTLTRLNPDAYALLEKNFRPPILDKTASDKDAAYLVGIQHVLKVIRDGFTT